MDNAFNKMLILGLAALILATIGCTQIPPRDYICPIPDNSGWERGLYTVPGPDQHPLYYAVHVDEPMLPSQPDYLWISVSSQLINSPPSLSETYRKINYQPNAIWLELNGEKLRPEKVYLRPENAPVDTIDQPVTLSPPGTRTGRRNSVLVGFPIARPSANSNAVLPLGSMAFGTITVALPEYKYCHEPGHYKGIDFPLC